MDFDKPFGVRTDASGYAIGAVLFQLDDEGNEKPISYASRTLNGTEQKYSASEREMLAIYDWIRYWRPYLWGTHFKVYTDHSPLTGIKTKKDVSRRLTKMILNLQEYDFELHYTPGKLNVVADALSRNPIAGYEQVPIKEITEMIGALLNNKDIKEELNDEPLNCSNHELYACICAMHGVWGERRKVNDTRRREIIAEKAEKALKIQTREMTTLN